MIEEALKVLITTAVPALTRFYPVQAAQAVTVPFAVQQRIGTNAVRSLSGPSGLTQARIQIDIYDLDYDAARAMALAVRQALDGYAGVVTIPATSPAETVSIRASSFQEERDFVEQTTNPILYRRSADFLIMFEE